MNRFNLQAWLVSALMLLAPISVLRAQQGAEDGAEDKVVEEIIVTARKVSETLQDAPITVNVLTSTELENSGVTQTADFIQLIPNVSLAESQTIGTAFLTVRGLSRVRNGELPVAVVVDDVLTVNARQFVSQIYDVDQIEVVKGPQGAIYGRNASNGAVVINTKPPTPGGEMEGHVKLSYGEANEIGVEGVVGSGFGEKWAFRVAGRYLDREGYFTNVTIGKDVDPFNDLSLRGRLSWFPSDTLSLDLKASVSQHEGKGIGFHWPIAFIWFGLPLTELGLTADQITEGGADLVDVPYVANNEDRGTRDTSGLSLKVNWDLGWAELKSATTYDTLETSSVADRAPYHSGTGDGTQHSYVDVSGFSQELRLSSSASGPISWQAGLYYLSWERLRSTVSGLDTGQGIIAVTEVPELESSRNPTCLDPGCFLSFVEDSYAFAVFGGVDWEINDRLKLSFAARQDSETREQNINEYNTAGRVYKQQEGSVVVPYGAVACDAVDADGNPVVADPEPDVNCGAYTTFDTLLANTERKETVIEKDFSQFQPKISASYEISEGLNVYGNWGIGYRAGQFNYPGIEVISSTAKPVIEPEENSAFEAGVKFSRAGLRLSAAVFSSTVKNTQYFPFDGLAFVQIFEDVDEAKLSGAEIEAVWQPLPGMNLYASYGITSSEITAYAERPGTVGNDLPYVPENTLNLGIQYQRPLTSSLSFLVRADFEQRGEQYWTPENANPREALSLINLRLAVMSESWSASLYINNLADKTYNSEIVTPLFLHPAPPRVWRLDFRYEF